MRHRVSLDRPVITRSVKQYETFSSEKSRYKVLVGSSVSLPARIGLTIVCQATGTPKPTITWSRGDVKIEGSSNNIKIKSEGRLRIKVLTSDDIGRYECTATNTYGYDTATTNVQIAGEFTGSFHFSCIFGMYIVELNAI